MKPRIEILTEKKLIGMKMEMSFANDRTAELWKKCRPKLNRIDNRVDSLLYSMQQMNIQDFTPTAMFEKWAAVEVSEIPTLLNELESYTISGGKYAVFTHNGPASTFYKTYSYIFESWLPTSEYRLDNREQFEQLTEDYHPADPNATEEVWVPIK
ncbi:GyrI-like domain-containing protein [Bacillus sp. 2205SS5-2]|uniref:GyrI-like domain-containing protein n=1 Tax=Bacillus sp. 2205SS5-2 TaxID=3109031 RepID=UPI003003A90A